MKQDHGGQKNYLTLNMVVEAMKRWSVRFKDRKPDPAEMTFLAKEYFIDLTETRVTPEEFAAANKAVCRYNRFFPVMGDILAAVDEYRSKNRRYNRADIEWKKNFPELLDEKERVILGISKGEVERAKRIEASGTVKQLISNIGN